MSEDELEVARGLLERCYRDYVRMAALQRVVAFPPWPLTDDIANFLGKERIGEKGIAKKASKKRLQGGYGQNKEERTY